MSIDLDDILDDEDEPSVDDGLEAAEEQSSVLLGAEEIASRVRRLVELRIANDEKKIAADKAKKELDDYQAIFFDEYARSPIKGSITVDLGDDLGEVQIIPRKTNYGRILDRDKAVEFFREREKLPEFVKEDFRMKRLHELVREHIEQNKPLPPGVDFYTKEYFTISFKD